MPSVAWISIAPVKGLALARPDEVLLGPAGIESDRRFHVVDAAGRLVNGKRAGTLVQIRPELRDGRLALRVPGGPEAEGEIALGEPVETSFYGRPVPGRVVEGPFGPLLSAHAGMELRLVMPDRPGTAVDRRGTISLLSVAALGTLAAEELDARRFRMTFGIAGVQAHEEDGWVGRSVRIGEAVVRVEGNVGRCLITGQDPDTGRADFDTLAALRKRRGEVETTEPLPFGVHAAVVEPGRVRLGDPVGP